MILAIPFTGRTPRANLVSGIISLPLFFPGQELEPAPPVLLYRQGPTTRFPKFLNQRTCFVGKDAQEIDQACDLKNFYIMIAQATREQAAVVFAGTGD